MKKAQNIMKMIVDTWSRNLNTKFTLGDYFFGTVKLTKDVDPEKYRYSGYIIGFVARSYCPINSKWCKNLIIFCVDNSFSVHTDNTKDYILVLGEGLKDGLDNTTITVEAKYPVNITKNRKNICLGLHYNAVNNFLNANDVRI